MAKRGTVETYEVYYVKDVFNVHAVIKATSDAHARALVQRMMENDEAFGFDLAYRKVKG